MRIFLSYRRQDVGGYAGRLYDALSQRLGEKNVFQDVTAIAPGQDFARAIHGALDASDAVLAVIGPGWAAVDEEGRSRLQQPDDYVRRELATALTRDLPVVPVLLGGASMPSAADLPEDLRALSLRQAVVVRDESWRQDVDALVRSLTRASTPDRADGRRWRGVAALTLAALVVFGGLAWWQLRDGDDGGGEPASVAACAPPGGEGWSRLTIGPDALGESTTGEATLIFEVEGGSWRSIGPGRWQVTLQTTMENRAPEASYHGDWQYDELIVGRRAFEKTCFSPTPELVIPGTVGEALVGYEVRCEPTGYIELVLNGSTARIAVTGDPEPSRC